jgi:hypothetical protein
MATGAQVLQMLLPDSEWSISGDSYENIDFYGGVSITKKEFEEGFLQYDAWKAEQDATKAASKAALLDRLGITADEAKLLLA